MTLIYRLAVGRPKKSTAPKSAVKSSLALASEETTPIDKPTEPMPGISLLGTLPLTSVGTSSSSEPTLATQFGANDIDEPLENSVSALQTLATSDKAAKIAVSHLREPQKTINITEMEPKVSQIRVV